MRREFSAARTALTAEVDEVLDGMGDASVRARFEALGARGLLAVHYPPAYGGRGLTFADHAAVSERMGMRGLPDVPHLITVQGVGCPLLTFGTERQRSRWLPEIASGRLFASLLLSEVNAGSDLTRIDTVALPDGDGDGDGGGSGGGWRISGEKTWSLYTKWSGIGLCSVRTRRGEHRYDGISLFLIDLSAPGVEIASAPRAAEEPYCTVTLDEVAVGADALLGEVHQGWALLPTIIGFERGGFDYLTRARTWLAAARDELRRRPRRHQAELAAGFVRQEFLVDAARALAHHVAGTADDGLEVDEITAAYAKLATGQAAQSVARWAGEELLPLADAGESADRAALRLAVAEAPELTVSGGAQDLQLDLIASDLHIGGGIR